MSDHGKRRAAGFRSVPDAAVLLSAVPGIRQSPPFWRAAAALADRLRRFRPLPAVEPDDFWLDVRKQLSELPQMRGAGPEAPSGPAAAFGRRSSDRSPPACIPAPGLGRLTGRLPAVSQRLFRVGRHVGISAPNGHDWFIAAALIAFFALGYLAAVASGGMTS